MEAAAITPEVTPGWLLPRSTMLKMLAQCKAGTDAIMNEGGPNRTVLHAMDVGLPGFDNYTAFGMYPASCFSHGWQTSFYAQVAAWCAQLFPEFGPLAGYIAKNMLARTDGEAFDSSYATEYCLLLRPAVDAQWYTSWSDCWVANAPILGVPVTPLINELRAMADYQGGCYGALAALAQARAAGVQDIPAEIDTVLPHYARQMDVLLMSGGNNFIAWNNSFAMPPASQSRFFPRRR
jgi:hypothetical protein